MKRRLSFGAHNLHDTTGVAAPFADIICFTEAIPKRVRRQLKATHRLLVCGAQRDLIIAVRRDLPIRNIVKHYRPVHGGIPLVTPHRGVFWITFELWGEGFAVVCEHRINAAFPPYRRGEAWLRPRWWKKHTRISLRIITRLITKGRTVLAAGDLNTIPGVDGYEGILEERGHDKGHGFDRQGVSDGVEILTFRAGPRRGSDHPSLVMLVLV